MPSPASGSLVSSGSIPTLYFYPASGTLTLTGQVPRIITIIGLFEHALYGKVSFVNNAIVKSQGLYGQTAFTSTIPKGRGLYGNVAFIDHSLGFLGNTLTIAELFTIITPNGITARLTSHSENITYDGNEYLAIPMRRGTISTKADLEVDKVEVEMAILGLTIGGQSYSMLQVLKRGFLRDASVRIVAVDYEDLTYDKFRFHGFISDSIAYTSGVMSFNVGSALDRLKDKFPKLIYSEFCPHLLFGTYCTLNEATWRESGTVLFSTTSSRIYSDVFLFSNKAQGYWLRGEILVTDVASEEYDVGRVILAHEDGYVDLLLPFGSAPLTGETFNVWPGCDKSGETCADTFNNYANFLGFEYIPKPEVMTG